VSDIRCTLTITHRDCNHHATFDVQYVFSGSFETTMLRSITFFQYSSGFPVQFLASVLPHGAFPPRFEVGASLIGKDHLRMRISTRMQSRLSSSITFLLPILAASCLSGSPTLRTHLGRVSAGLPGWSGPLITSRYVCLVDIREDVLVANMDLSW
jgi:hypothetical protein